MWHATIGQGNIEPGLDGAQGLVGALSPAQPDPLLPATDLTSLDGALQGPCRWCQGRVGVLEPGQSGLIGVELRCLLRGIQEPALGVGAARSLFVLWSVSHKSQS